MPSQCRPWGVQIVQERVVPTPRIVKFFAVFPPLLPFAGLFPRGPYPAVLRPGWDVNPPLQIGWDKERRRKSKSCGKRCKPPKIGVSKRKHKEGDVVNREAAVCEMWRGGFRDSSAAAHGNASGIPSMMEWLGWHGRPKYDESSTMSEQETEGHRDAAGSLGSRAVWFWRLADSLKLLCWIFDPFASQDTKTSAKPRHINGREEGKDHLQFDLWLIGSASGCTNVQTRA